LSQISIEQCEFSYRCPKTWDRLFETNIESVRYCDQCDRNVYLCDSSSEAVDNASKGRCVAVPIELTPYSRDLLESERLVVGLMKPPPIRSEERLLLQNEFRGQAPRWLGIDGCRAGWFYVGIDADGAFSFGVLPEIGQVSSLLGAAERVLVDIPIGLPSETAPRRECETLARSVLQGRRSSVFSVPARSVLSMPSYEAANAENRRVLGVGLSRQSWNIVPKIREADRFLRRSKDDRFHEMHPEVAFWALNDKAPMRHTKKKPHGLDERLAVLEHQFAPSAACFEAARRAFLKGEVASDDIVDALAGAVTAMQGSALKSFPAEPATDDEGLEMKMVYAEV